MEITSEIINNQINQLENEKLFKELEHKNRRYEYNRRYYLKNRERLIKKLHISTLSTYLLIQTNILHIQYVLYLNYYLLNILLFPMHHFC